jgi:murein DD-endopeptidase MepM/ murein hydrolase activator NlpD
LVRLFARTAVAVWRFAGDWRGLRPVLTRSIAHVAIISVAVAVLLLSSTRWPALAYQSIPSVQEILAQQSTPESTEAAMAEVLAQNGQPPEPDESGPLSRLAQPHTIIPERPRLGIVTYTVRAGDTVESIAAQFGLDPTTIAWSNPAVEDAPDLLRVGQELTILPVDGVYHEVEEGDTLESIAEDYEAEAADITACQYNPLEAPLYRIRPGMSLIVPGGEKPYVARTITSYAGPVPEGAQGSGLFDWPVLGYISQGYWYAHRAIDVAAPTGTAVRAADSGYVSFAGWTDIGYGYLIVIDHGNGFSTYYAHLSNFYVAPGQAVERGQVIAAVGNTGWSTGPHTHFEIRYGGVPQNPRAYLP